ncbi:MAG: transposase [Aggregatilineales bacterium]
MDYEIAWALLNECIRYNGCMKKKTRKANTKNTKKGTYRIRNWSDYNKNLVQRGSITLCISEDSLANWHPQVAGKRQRGGQVNYSDQAIECLLVLKAVYRLPYRQTVGFAQSVLDLMGADVRVPDYTTLCKRSAELSVDCMVFRVHPLVWLPDIVAR